MGYLLDCTFPKKELRNYIRTMTIFVKTFFSCSHIMLLFYLSFTLILMSIHSFFCKSMVVTKIVSYMVIQITHLKKLLYILCEKRNTWIGTTPNQKYLDTFTLRESFLWSQPQIKKT